MKCSNPHCKGCSCPEVPIKLRAYRLLKPMPQLSAGVVFVHDVNDIKAGSVAHGCMKLAWNLGLCQSFWCGGTYILPGQLAEDKEWFEEVPNTDGRYWVGPR